MRMGSAHVAGAGGAAATVELAVALVIVAIAVALFARRLRFPYTLALVLVGLVIGAARLAPSLRLDPDLILFLFLPALLFEGAWNMDLRALRANWLAVALLAVPGLLLSLAVVALALTLGAGLPLLLALLLGAIISPTDPVAVLALLRQLGMPARLRLIVEAESLFNDGVGAALYAILLSVLLVGLGVAGEFAEGPPLALSLRVIWLVIGGPLIGIAVAFAISWVVRQVNDHLLETLVTFGVAYGVFLLATLAHTSGILAVICAGLTLGSYGRRIGMSRRTSDAVDTVWEFIGYLANATLFLLLGVQIGGFNAIPALGVILWATLGVLAGRALMVYTLLPLHDAIIRRRAAPGQPEDASDSPAPIPAAWRPLILMSGLRGALSLALALELPALIPQRDLLALAVYGVVLITLLGQGVLMRFLLPQLRRGALAKVRSKPATT